MLRSACLRMRLSCSSGTVVPRWCCCRSSGSSPAISGAFERRRRFTAPQTPGPVRGLTGRQRRLTQASQTPYRRAKPCDVSGDCLEPCGWAGHADDLRVGKASLAAAGSCTSDRGRFIYGRCGLQVSLNGQADDIRARRDPSGHGQQLGTLFVQLIQDVRRQADVDLKLFHGKRAVVSRQHKHSTLDRVALFIGLRDILCKHAIRSCRFHIACTIPSK